MTTFLAQPHNVDATGFNFKTYDEYLRLSGENRNSNGDLIKEYHIQLIDGDKVDCELASVVALNQANIATFIKSINRWEESQKIEFILAVRECAFVLDNFDCDPDDFNLSIYEAQHHEELGRIFAADELLGPVPRDLTPFLDYDGIGLHLGADYDETDIAGRHFFFRPD